MVKTGLSIIDQILKFVNKFDFSKSSKKKGKSSSTPYEYSDYTKHVMVYANGHGIVLYTFALRVINRNECEKIFRIQDVRDGTKSFAFKDFEAMQNTPIKNRYSDFGFWYESENNFLFPPVECYGSDKDSNDADCYLKDNPKYLRWYFEIDQSKIENGKEYTFSYAIAMPGMFPIKDGKKWIEELPSLDYNTFSSEFTSETTVNKSTYKISFDKDISLKKSSIKCQYIDDNKKPYNMACRRVNTCIYQKYIVIREAMAYNNTIRYSWKLD